MKFKPFKNQDYKSIKSDLLRNGRLFEDDVFEAKIESIKKFKTMDEDLSKQNISRIEWRRPKEIVDNPKFIVNDISAKDINQSSVLTNCWFLAAVMSVTTNAKYIEINVPKNQSFSKEEYCGIFHFRFWQYGVWYDVVIDDRLPYFFDNNGNEGLLFNSNKVEVNEFWSPLLEKAYAKLLTCYELLGWGYTNDALVDLTGGVSEVIELVKIRSEGLIFWNSLSHAYNMGSLCGCSIAPSQLRPGSGLQSRHAYSITKVIEIEPTHKYYHKLLNTVSKVIEDVLRKDFKQVVYVSKPSKPNYYGWIHDDNVTGASNFYDPSSSYEPVNEMQSTDEIDEYATGSNYKKDSNESIRLIRLRNPHGCGAKEWQGRFSDCSQEWQNIDQTIKEELGLTSEQDGEFWMEFDDFMHHFSRLQFVHVDLNAFKDEVSLPKAYWRQREYHCAWVSGKNAGGSDESQDSYWTNPQFLVNVKSTDRSATDGKTTLIVSLMHKDILEHKILAKGDLRKVNFPKKFKIYRVKKNAFDMPDCTKLSKDELDLDFVVSSKVQEKERELTQRFRVPSQHSYVIIPSANINTSGSFLLRLYTEISFEEQDCRELHCAENALKNRMNNINKLFNEVENRIITQHDSVHSEEKSPKKNLFGLIEDRILSKNNSTNSQDNNDSYSYANVDNSYNNSNSSYSNNTNNTGDGAYGYNSYNSPYSNQGYN